MPYFFNRGIKDVSECKWCVHDCCFRVSDISVPEVKNASNKGRKIAQKQEKNGKRHNLRLTNDRDEPPVMFMCIILMYKQGIKRV